MLDHPDFLPFAVLSTAVLQVLILFFLIRLSGRVSALARRMDAPNSASTPVETVTVTPTRKESDGEQSRWFDAFLAEDPAREQLPKKEQFAAFRRWREEKGLNWKGSGGG